MPRIFVAICCAAALAACVSRAAADDDAQPPVRYELSINGENFTIDADRINTLKSAEKPGTTYEVGVRLAQFQHWKLNTIEFDYHLNYSIADDRKPTARTATLKHQLGFVMLLTDLGGPLKRDKDAEVLRLMAESVEKTDRESGGRNFDVGKPKQAHVGGKAVWAQTIRFEDADKVEHASLVYLVLGEKLACSCIVQCLGDDRENVIPLVMPTVESLAPR